MKTKTYFLWILAVSCSILFTIRDAGSCSVPVFRYALERWKPDPYKGIFIHQGAITQKDRALLQQLEEASQNPTGPLNLLVRPVDPEVFGEEKLKDLLKGPIPDKLPVLAIWLPDQMGKKVPLWKLELTQSVVNALVTSPKRRQLTDRILGGDSIVWLFVPSGNAQKDKQAKELLQKRLDLELDFLHNNPFYVLDGVQKKKLAYGFSIITVSRTDPQERLFLDMLMHCESDLFEFQNESMVFPVFGRGRLLGCLFGEYINEDKIRDVVSYLASACSCEVKAQHPGIDLLASAFWDRITMGDIFSDYETETPELTGVMPESPIPAKNEIAQDEDTPEPVMNDLESPPIQSETVATKIAQPEKAAHASILTILGFTLGSVVVVVISASLLLNHRRKEK